MEGGGREGGREGGKEGGREGERKEGGRKGGREERREGGKEGNVILKTRSLSLILLNTHGKSTRTFSEIPLLKEPTSELWIQ